MGARNERGRAARLEREKQRVENAAEERKGNVETCAAGGRKESTELHGFEGECQAVLLSEMESAGQKGVKKREESTLGDPENVEKEKTETQDGAEAGNGGRHVQPS